VIGVGELVTSGQAAKALGVSLRSLQQWVREGKIIPDYVTPGGHARWDVDRVRHELRENIARRHDPK
jgi:DNA-binding transcriptional MerR regulator